jgi:hypothetical protein
MEGLGANDRSAVIGVADVVQLAHPTAEIRWLICVGGNLAEPHNRYN